MDSDASPRRTRSSAVLVVAGVHAGRVGDVRRRETERARRRVHLRHERADAAGVPVGEHGRHVGSGVDQKAFEGLELCERLSGGNGDFGLLGRLPGLIRGERVGR